MANEGAFQRARSWSSRAIKTFRFFVVISGALEILRPNGREEELITVHTAGQFMGDVGMLSGRRMAVGARMREGGGARRSITGACRTWCRAMPTSAKS